MNTRFVCLVVTVLLAFTSCNHKSKEKVDEAGEEMQSAEHDLKDAVLEATKEEAEDFQKFKTEAEQKINDNQKRIDELKARLDKASKKLKAEYQQKVNDLEKNNADLKKQLADYKDEGQKDWEKFKTDFNSKVDQVKKQLDDSTYHDF